MRKKMKVKKATKKAPKKKIRQMVETIPMLEATALRLMGTISSLAVDIDALDARLAKLERKET